MDLRADGIQFFAHPGRVGINGLTDEDFVSDGYDAYLHYPLLLDRYLLLI
jgi:hypothetical protein